MSDQEYYDEVPDEERNSVPSVPHHRGELSVPSAEPVRETVTKPKKKSNWEFTPARKAALEKAHKKRSEKAEERKRLKEETEKKALEIIEDRRLQTTAEDDKLDHVLYELEKLKKHVVKEHNPAPEKLRPPPLRRSRKKPPPPPETESELTMTEQETEVETTETESLPRPRRKKNPPPVERSEDYQQPKINIMFG